MKNALIALAAASAVAVVSAPAFAQSFAGDTAQREAVIQDRISDGVQGGDLSYGQAARLRSELRQIVDLDARYQDEGMTGWQERDLDSRLSLLTSRLNYDISQSRDLGD